MNYWQKKWISERHRADKYHDLFLQERKTVSCLHGKTMLVLLLGIIIGIFISYVMLTYHTKKIGFDSQEPLLHQQSHIKSPQMIRIRPD